MPVNRSQQVGKYYNRLAFQRLIPGQNSLGEPIQQWIALRTVDGSPLVRWASIEPLSSRELWQAQQVRPDLTLRITCRYIAGLTAKHRAVKFPRAFLANSWTDGTALPDGSRVFNLEPSVNPGEQGLSTQMTILSKEEPLSVLDPAPPVPLAVNPVSGNPGSTTAVTITGTGFQVAGRTTVTFGSAAAVVATVSSPTTLTCTAPAQAQGVVTVTVTSPDYQTGTLTNGFAYVSSLLTGLLAWYALNETPGNSRLDSSGAAQTLTEFTGSVASTAGVLGNAAQFAADGHYLRRDGSLLGSATACSFACFIKPTDAGTYTWMSCTLGGALRVALRTSGGSVFWTASGAYTLSAAIASGVFSHVAGTYDGINERLYVNGVLVGTNPATAAFGISRFALGNTAAPGESALGALDLAGVWSRALTGAEITALYNAGAGRDYPFA